MDQRFLIMLAPFGLRPKATLSRRALPLAIELVRRGWRVHILAPSDLWPADAGLTIDIQGVTVEHGPLSRARGPLGMVESTRWMTRRVLALRPDLIHLFKPKGYGGMAALALRRIAPALPLVVDTDDWEGRGGWNDRLPYSRPIKLLINWQERILPRRAQAVTVASRTLGQQVAGFGVAAERITYVPNGVHIPGRPLAPRSIARATLDLGENPTVLLYTRFWEFGLAQIVACLVGLVAQHPAARMLVVGAGENGEEDQLTALAQRAGVAQALDSRGWADERLIAAALAASDVALYPMDDTLLNRAKCSAKLTEQMQAGLPLVAARVGQVAEYIEDGRSGLLVAPGDGGALARGVIALLSQPEQAAALGQAARQRIERHFAWPQLAEALADVYAEALAGRRR
jgi:glycosyltransferase involved in cell wall biosynthesis